MELNEQIKNSLTELRKSKKRKFDQTVDLIINLQKFDLKKTPLNVIINVPHKVKDKKIGAFFESKNSKVETITPHDFKKYGDKNSMKKLVRNFDFFIAQASVMPKVASTFGRALGPSGKMPSPQLGIILNADDKTLNELIKKINNSVKLRAKEASIKVAIGKESMGDEQITENIMSVFNGLLKHLPRDKENIKNIEVKFTMTKPQKITLK